MAPWPRRPKYQKHPTELQPVLLLGDPPAKLDGLLRLVRTSACRTGFQRFSARDQLFAVDAARRRYAKLFGCEWIDVRCSGESRMYSRDQVSLHLRFQDVT
jgi:hypothetical protein